MILSAFRIVESLKKYALLIRCSYFRSSSAQLLLPSDVPVSYNNCCSANRCFFQRLLHNRFPGTKRFSVEGAETLVPLLDLILGAAAEQGVDEAIIGTRRAKRSVEISTRSHLPFRIRQRNLLILL